MSAPMQFAPGDIVWTESGNKAEYVSVIGGQHAVRLIYAEQERDDDEPYEYPAPRIDTVDRVFAKAPVEVIDAEVSKRQAALEDIVRRTLDKRRELTDLERRQKETLKNLQQHEELAHLEDWLAGKITHFVVVDSYKTTVRVQAWDAAMEMKSDYGNGRGFDLLVLSAGWDKVLKWQRKETPRYQYLRPHTSEDAAIADAITVITQSLADAVKSKDVIHSLGELIKSADLFKVDVPEHLRTTLANRQRAHIQTYLDKARNEVAVYEARIAALQVPA